MSKKPHPPPRKFSTGASMGIRRRNTQIISEEGEAGVERSPMYLGISATPGGEATEEVYIGLAIRDITYPLNFHMERYSSRTPEAEVVKSLTKLLESYEDDHVVKIIGAGVFAGVNAMFPTLCSSLWLKLDIIPIVIDEHKEAPPKPLDDHADSMARKCIKNFGPSLVPLLHVGHRGIVQPDDEYKIQLNTVQDNQNTCSVASWETMMTYARKLTDKKIKVAFFSSTPQGGGVALMRHALVRFSQLMGVDLKWYVPKPRPGIFRITKNIHNILQGVSHPDQRISKEEQAAITSWIWHNADRYWLTEGGPLCPPGLEGGADVIIIDDPQMPALIPLIKEKTPNRPVLYRSHIQIRSDLVDQPGTPQADVWDFLWSNIQHADMFISHPIPKFVPGNVPREKVTYLPATTDWLDGLNKPIDHSHAAYYKHLYNVAAHSKRMVEINWARKYIIQVARFDPAKGIDTVIRSYVSFRNLCEAKDITEIPQLIVCGNGSIDDPDGTIVYDSVMDQIEQLRKEETNGSELIKDISVMRLEPNDQLLNTLIANAHVVLQLSTREGFEVKVSEALHAGRPVIATNVGGIPLQVKDKTNGFLVEPGDFEAVAGHLLSLFKDDKLHKKMSHEAANGVSDEVGTVGNAIGWYYLAAKWAEVGVEKDGKGGLKGGEKWVNDMAREEAGYPYEKGENRLHRHFTQKKE